MFFRVRLAIWYKFVIELLWSMVPKALNFFLWMACLSYELSLYETGLFSIMRGLSVSLELFYVDWYYCSTWASWRRYSFFNLNLPSTNSTVYLWPLIFYPFSPPKDTAESILCNFIFLSGGLSIDVTPICPFLTSPTFFFYFSVYHLSLSESTSKLNYML